MAAAMSCSVCGRTPPDYKIGCIGCDPHFDDRSQLKRLPRVVSPAPDERYTYVFRLRCMRNGRWAAETPTNRGWDKWLAADTEEQLRAQLRRFIDSRFRRHGQLHIVDDELQVLERLLPTDPR